MITSDDEFEYSVFISYRHLPDDRKWAKWLLSALETYRTPKVLQKQGMPARLGKVFRDEDEIPASSDLSSLIKNALGKSKFLVVVCSKDTPASMWVSEEIRTFHALGRSDYIIALLIDGEPDDAFPELLLKLPKSVSDDGEITWSDDVREPIAADVRSRDDTSDKELKRSALLRVSASILGVKFDDLKRRDEARQRRRMQFYVAASLAVVVFTSVLSGYALVQRQAAILNAERANKALAAATQTANGLVFNLAEEFRDSGLPNATILRILSEAQKLQDRLAAGGEENNDLLRSRAATLDERSRSLENFGDPDGALNNATQSLTIMRKLAASQPTNTGYQRDISVGLHRIAVIKQRQNPAAALALFEESLTIIRKLVASEPTNTRFQHDVSGILTRIAYIKQFQDPAAALALNEESLTIVRKLAAAEPTNTQFQHDIFLSLDKIAVIKQRQNPAAALAMYEEGLTIIRKLAASDPTNTQFQRDIFANLNRIATLKKRQDPSAALAMYKEGLTIMRKLTASEPTNTGFQRDLFVSLNTIANIKQRQKPAAALALYEKGLAIIRKLAASEPTNTKFQRDVTASLDKVAAIKKRQDPAAALALYEESLTVRRRLAASNPTNTRYQRGVSASLDKIAAIKKLQNPSAALALYEESLTIRRRLAASNPTKTRFQSEVSATLVKIAGIKQRQDPTAALALYEEGLTIMRKIAASEPTNTRIRKIMVINLFNLSSLKTGQVRKDILSEGLAIALKLDAAGKLSSNQKSWPKLFQRQLDKE